MITLQQLTDAWGRYWADQSRTRVEFTCSTDFSRMTEGLRPYQAKADMHKIIYDSDSVPTTKSISGLDKWYDNSSEADQSATFSTRYTQVRSLGWTLEEGIEVGVELSATEEVPAVASGTETLKTTISFRATEAGSLNSEHEFTETLPFVIPAMSSMHCEASILEQEYNIGFTAVVSLSGSAGICFADPVQMNYGPGKWRYWAIDLRTVFSEVRDHTSADLRGYGQAGDGTLEVRTRGVFKGAQRTNMQVKATQFPLRSVQPPDNPGRTIMRRYLLPAAIGAG